MSVMALYTYPRWEDGPDDDLTFEAVDEPAPPTEALTIAAGVVWWTAAPIDTED